MNLGHLKPYLILLYLELLHYASYLSYLLLSLSLFFPSNELIINVLNSATTIHRSYPLQMYTQL